MAILEIKDLKVTYGEKRILNRINLNLEKGESLSIVGESGGGKSTLGLSIMGLLEGAIAGEILFEGKNLTLTGENEFREIRWNRISMVFQNVENALNPLYTALDQVSEPIVAHKTGTKNDAKRRGKELLNMVGVPQLRFDAYPHELSGGEKQRVLIAMALANDPDLIILDEPTASLDAITKLDMITLIRSVCDSNRKLGTILLTHDLAEASQLSTKMAVLYAGRVLELGPTPTIISNPRHPYTRALLRCYPSMTTTKDLQGIKGRMDRLDGCCPFYPRCTQSIARCQKEMPELEAAKNDGQLIACHRGGIIPLLELINLTKSFGSLRAVDSIDLTLYEGETLALVGETGSGKTTTAKTIIGLFEATEGEILLEGECISKTERDRDFYRNVQMIFQNPMESLSHRLSIREAVREPLDIQKIGDSDERERRVKQTLKEVSLPITEVFLNEYPHHLSQGEAQRVAIARALILNPKLLIADEPTSALDASTQAKVMKLLLNLQEKRGVGILFITHNLALARKISDRIAVMFEGKIVEERPSNEIIRNPSHPYTQKLLDAAPKLLLQSEDERRE